MAISQVRQCLSNPEQFALCVIERPENREIPDEDYIRNQIKWITKASEVVEEPYELYSSFYDKKARLSSAMLDVSLREEMKIAINMSYIDDNHSTFDELIEFIQRQLS